MNSNSSENARRSIAQRFELAVVGSLILKAHADWSWLVVVIVHGTTRPATTNDVWSCGAEGQADRRVSL